MKFYRDADVDAIQRYGEAHPATFAYAAIDYAHRTLAVAFTSDVETHRQRLATLVPRAPVKLVLVRNSARELEALAMRIQKDESFRKTIQMQLYTMGWGNITNRVQVTGAACHVAAAKTAFLERYGRDVVGITMYPLPGREPAQPQSGNGWRLLSEVPGGTGSEEPIYADDRAEYDALTAKVRLSTSPDVDFDREIVAAFVTSGARRLPASHPCDWVHFAGVEFDVEGKRVVAWIRHPRAPGIVCNSMFTPFTYLIALERAKLPGRPFTLAQREDELGISRLTTTVP